MLAQELGLLAGHEMWACGPGRSAPRVDPFCADDLARPCVPSVCEQTYSMLQTTAMRLLGVAQVPTNTWACNSGEALSLKNFLDEDIPKFPFARSPHGAATWTRVAA